MFATLASKLRDNGWGALIPLMSGEKRPAIREWERFNTSPPSDAQIDHWARIFPHAGIGLAYGPDGVVGIDLDFTDACKAGRAVEIAEETLGATPLVRIGMAPKALAFYQASPKLEVSAKNFGGFEIFSNSGQTVLFGIHPGTGRSYQWPDESPETLAPQDLPIITQERLDGFVLSMSPLREE